MNVDNLYCVLKILLQYCSSFKISGSHIIIQSHFSPDYYNGDDREMIASYGWSYDDTAESWISPELSSSNMDKRLCDADPCLEVVQQIVDIIDNIHPPENELRYHKDEPFYKGYILALSQVKKEILAYSGIDNIDPGRKDDKTT